MVGVVVLAAVAVVVAVVVVAVVVAQAHQSLPCLLPRLLRNIVRAWRRKLLWWCSRTSLTLAVGRAWPFWRQTFSGQQRLTA